MPLTNFYFNPCHRTVIFVDPQVHDSDSIWFGGHLYYITDHLKPTEDERLQEVSEGIYKQSNREDQRCMEHLESARFEYGSFQIHSTKKRLAVRGSADLIERSALAWLLEGDSEFEWSHSMLEVGPDLAPGMSTGRTRSIFIRKGVHCTEVHTASFREGDPGLYGFGGTCLSTHYYGNMPLIEFLSQVSRGNITLTTPVEDLSRTYTRLKQLEEMSLFKALLSKGVVRGELTTLSGYSHGQIHNLNTLYGFIPRGRHIQVNMLDDASTSEPKDPPPPTECGACKRPFDAYLKRFDFLCGDCVPKP